MSERLLFRLDVSQTLHWRIDPKITICILRNFRRMKEIFPGMSSFKTVVTIGATAAVVNGENNLYTQPVVMKKAVIHGHELLLNSNEPDNKQMITSIHLITPPTACMKILFTV